MRKLRLPLAAILMTLVLTIVAAACTQEVIKEVPVEKEVVVEKEVIKEVPVEKIVEKEVVKEVPVEKIIEKEVVKEVVVEKEVVKRVVREVIATAVPLSAGLAVEQAKYGGEIKVTAQGSIKSMDPTFSPAYVTYAVATHVWEAPLAHDADYVTQQTSQNRGYGTHGGEAPSAVTRGQYHGDQEYVGRDRKHRALDKRNRRQHPDGVPTGGKPHNPVVDPFQHSLGPRQWRAVFSSPGVLPQAMTRRARMPC